MVVFSCITHRISKCVPLFRRDNTGFYTNYTIVMFFTNSVVYDHERGKNFSFRVSVNKLGF